MKVKHLTTKSGKIIPNQFSIEEGCHKYLQSFERIMCKQSYHPSYINTLIDQDTWNNSMITLKYVYKFLGKTKKEITEGIKEGSIILVNLNA